MTSPVSCNITYNFELLDAESGLFAFATGYYSGLNYGFVEFWEDRMSVVSMIKKTGLEKEK